MDHQESPHKPIDKDETRVRCIRGLLVLEEVLNGNMKVTHEHMVILEYIKTEMEQMMRHADYVTLKQAMTQSPVLREATSPRTVAILALQLESKWDEYCAQYEREHPETIRYVHPRTLPQECAADMIAQWLPWVLSRQLEEFQSLSQRFSLPEEARSEQQ
jgi:hypothetical protein